MNTHVVKIKINDVELFVKQLNADEIYYTSDKAQAERFSYHMPDTMSYVGRTLTGMPFSESPVYDDDLEEYTEACPSWTDVQSISFISG